MPVVGSASTDSSGRELGQESLRNLFLFLRKSPNFSCVAPGGRFQGAEAQPPSSRTAALPRLHRTSVVGGFEELEIFITVDDSDAIFRGTNLNDSSKHDYGFLLFLAAFIIQSHSCASADEESRVVILELITGSSTPHFFLSDKVSLAKEML